MTDETHVLKLVIDETHMREPMTDEALPPDVTGGGDQPAGPSRATPDRSGRQKRSRHPAHRSRIVAVGIGVAAMVGLVSNMEVSGSRAQAKDPTGSNAGSSTRANLGLPRSRSGKAVASRRPIVLTPHAVVHTVAAPAVGGSGGSGGSGYVAAAPAAAPVATTSGSTAH
jgi:hypothetical protein